MTLRRTPLPPRKKPLPRNAKPIARGKSPRRSNRQRQTREFTRAFGGEARVDWVRHLPCVAAGKHDCAGRIENVHVRSGGASRRADARWIVPACQALHREMHSRGQQSTAARYGLDFDALAEATDAAWQALTGTARP